MGAMQELTTKSKWHYKDLVSFGIIQLKHPFVLILRLLVRVLRCVVLCSLLYTLFFANSIKSLTDSLDSLFLSFFCPSINTIHNSTARPFRWTTG